MRVLVITALVLLFPMHIKCSLAQDLTGRWYHVMETDMMRMTSDLVMGPDGVYTYRMQSANNLFSCPRQYTLTGQYHVEANTIDFMPQAAERGCAGEMHSVDPKSEQPNNFNSRSAFSLDDDQLCFRLNRSESCYYRKQ
jgi:hypothetical protein